jgi:glycine/D-amino acid oxidase-like deaminating enzyme
MPDVEIAIIGGGLAGWNSAYALAESGKVRKEDVLVIDAGKKGRGNPTMYTGTDTPAVPAHSRLVTAQFEGFYSELIDECGPDYARTFDRFMTQGVKIVKERAAPGMFRHTGCYLLGGNDELPVFEKDFVIRKRHGANVELRDLSALAPLQANLQDFIRAFYLGDDGLLDVQSYVQMLSRGFSNLAENTIVDKLEQEPDGVLIKTRGAGDIKARKAIVATNAFSLTNGIVDPRVSSHLEPYWSHVLCYDDPGPNTTVGETIQHPAMLITRQDGILHINALDLVAQNDGKRFIIDEQAVYKEMKSIAEHFVPRLKGKREVLFHYGMFASTPDSTPIVGAFDDKPDINYVVGCNAAGIAYYAAATQVLPAVLGLKEMTGEEQRYADMLSPCRFT